MLNNNNNNNDNNNANNGIDGNLLTDRTVQKN